MKSMTRTSMFAIAMASACMIASAHAQEQTGTATVPLNEVYAVAPNGSLAPFYDRDCRRRLESRIGSQARTDWRIDTSSGMMSAHTTVFDVEVALYPMGISHSYSFMSDGVPYQLKQQGVHRVTYSMNTAFMDPESDVLFAFYGPYNCVLSNKASN